MNNNVLSHTLDNGLVLLAEPMPWLASAAFSFLVPAGCAYDPPNRGGMAGFVCEMTLRGAGSRDSRALVLDLDNLGVDRGESVSDSHVSYGGVTVCENFLPTLAIYADILRCPLMPADQFEAARAVMLQELQAVEDEPAQKVMQEVRRNYYPDPWGRPSQGDREAIEATGIDDVCRHYKQTFRPNGTILGVAGRFDWEQLKERVERLFADWEPVAAMEICETPHNNHRRHIDYDSQQTQIGIAYRGVPYCHDDYFPAWGAVGVLSGGMSARLFTEVRERRGLCYSIYAVAHSLKDRGGVFCYAGTTAERAQETLDVTLEEIVRLAEGVKSDELARLKARIKSSVIMQQESSSARSSSIARDWYHLGRTRSLTEIGRLVDDLTCESINAYLTANPPGDFTVVTLGPRELESRFGIS